MSVNGTTADALREAAAVIQLNPHLTANYVTYSARPDTGTISVQVSAGYGRSDDEQIAAVDEWGFTLGAQAARTPVPAPDGESLRDFYEFTVKIDRFHWHVYAPLTTHIPVAVSA